jgi:S1-C subfamily serine protease
VVEGVQTLRVRLASGKMTQGEKVGTAPNYDLAVIKISGGATLPYWTSRSKRSKSMSVSGISLLMYLNL